MASTSERARALRSETTGGNRRRRRLVWGAGAAAALLVAAALLYGFVMRGDGPKVLPPGEELFFTIATGSLAGTYYPVGDAIAGIVTNPADAVPCAREGACGPRGLVAVVQASPGSVANVKMVARGAAASALAQADIVAQAYEGTGVFADAAPQRELRALAGLYSEMVHVAVARGSGIEKLGDLAGKRVSVGKADSGTRPIARLVLDRAGLLDRVELVDSDIDRAADQLIRGDIDALFFVAGAPVRTLASLAGVGRIELLDLAGPEMEALADGEPYLGGATIAEGVYGDLPAVTTLGVPAIWITRSDFDVGAAYEMVRALWHPANREVLTGTHPRAAALDLEDAVNGIPIPLHPGAERFYREAGVLGTGGAPVAGGGR